MKIVASKHLHTHPHGQGTRSAFTLIEVLFATLAFSIVLAAINTVFYTSIRLRERADEKEKTFRPRIHALDILKKDLRATFFSEGFRANRFFCEPSTGLNVSADYLQFFTSSGATREEAPWSDIQMVEYYLAPTQDPRQEATSLDLVRAVTRNILTSSYQVPIEQHLVSGLTSFRLEFYDGEIWQSTWDSDIQDPVLPKATQIYLEFASDTSGKVLPPSLTQMVAILEEARASEDEEGEDDGTDRDDEEADTAGDGNQGNTGGQGTGGGQGGGNSR